MIRCCEIWAENYAFFFSWGSLCCPGEFREPRNKCNFAWCFRGYIRILAQKPNQDMSFIYPAFLFALSAIAIPVIIHLFRFRRFRTVYFPNIVFLQQLSEVSDKESRLKHLLILLARILTIAFLVMAFARPYIPSGEEGIAPEGNAVGVYIDNSFSMNALSGQGRLLDDARDRALEIAHIYGPSDRFLLLTNDFEGRHQRFVSRDEFINMVQEVSETARVRSVSEVMKRKNELFSHKALSNQRAYYLSDFQKSTAGLEDAEADSIPPAYFIPIEAAEEDNVYIDSLWFDRPVVLSDEAISMQVRVRNDGVQNLENQAIRLFLEGQQRAVASYNLAPGGEDVVQLSWTAGESELQQGYLEINDYPITFDDRMYFSYRVTREIPILGLEGDGRNTYLHALFGPQDLFSYRTMPGFTIDFSAFADQRLIILSGFQSISSGLSMALNDYVLDGGSLLIFPPAEMEYGSYGDFLARLSVDAYMPLDTTSMRVSEVNELHSIFQDVFEEIPENIDLPRSRKYYPIDRQLGSRGEDLLRLQNGRPFFSSHPAGEGMVYLSAVPLDDDFSNFQRHSVFVPIMINIALHSGQMQLPYHVLGSWEPVQVSRQSRDADRVYVLRRNGFEAIPEQRRAGKHVRLYFHDQIGEAQNYRLYMGDERVGGLSFNYDRRESQLDAYSHNELKNLLSDRQLDFIRVVDTANKPLDQTLLEMGMGKQLWRLFLIIALLFILAEMLLIRFWK